MSTPTPAHPKTATNENTTMITSQNPHTDVAIIGGGPAGSTAASVLKKYNPDLAVTIIEKETFPRDHVGESQLPSISRILDEIGAWDKVEAAGFPVKIGASYTWGRSQDRWKFDFYPVEKWTDEPRPAKFQGQRKHTAFQVDRSIYDTILLEHARELGTEVLQPTKVNKIIAENDRVQGLELDNATTLTANHYIDASGAVGLMRRALGVESEAPSELRNVAFWDYWRNADWAVEIGVGGTRVQVRSLPYGWIWFIPLGPDRVSIGLITPSEHFKSTGKTPKELYEQALQDQPEIAELIQNATPENNFATTKDWSHLADRLAGENWFLIGESAGFADPILAAGMSLAHSSARDAAYTILEIERDQIDRTWLLQRYDQRNRKNISQHIRFAKYWYASNGQFTDLQDHCKQIARDAGLRLTAQQAWRWLSQGGFTTESPDATTLGSFDLASAKQILERFDARGRTVPMKIHGKNTFTLNLKNANKIKIGVLRDGRIHQIDAYQRGDTQLPLTGNYGTVFSILQKTTNGREIFSAFNQHAAAAGPASADSVLAALAQSLEALVEDYWVVPSVDKSFPTLIADLSASRFLRDAAEADKALQQMGQHFRVVNRLDTLPAAS